jgi:hypothetical protein
MEECSLVNSSGLVWKRITGQFGCPKSVALIRLDSIGLNRLPNLRFAIF